MFRSSISSLLVTALCWTTALVQAHTVISYPGWRGDNLITNATFPYGMQWMYPCGGMPTTTNRTLWPIGGGAIAIQPGWFQGHATAFFYINLGFGTDGPDGGPINMSFPMISVFQITGPSKAPYPGTFCLPQVPLPVNASVKVGDNATIQVVETAVHGASLFSCVDITFAEPQNVAEVNSSNCYNSSDIGFNNVYSMAIPGTTTTTFSSDGTLNVTTTGAASSLRTSLRGCSTWAGPVLQALLVPVVVGAFWGWI